ncbi:restriction endonuclease subunit S [Thalassospira povalilytica]|uniref:Restriction endonuclease subunit S n=1 Tax=Thalassospira povalilytica TaxID=732237 RepID=A0A8I1SHL4_9PROT|nr:restriction endonuclease subunit S [Thalassospira povalilytica]MBN8195323.1 restriction endonuclease subunit S [Thalassospira povalilytica]
MWTNLTVGELVDAGHAEVKTGPFGTQLRASDYVDQGTPVINVRNIGFGTIRPEKLEFISRLTVERLSSHLLKPRDIVFGRKGAVERHVFIKDKQNSWFQGSDCLRLRMIDETRANSRYLSYAFLTRSHQSWMIQQCSHGATMPSLNQDIIKRIPINLPPVEVQNSIVAILSAYDDLIENNSRRIAILEEMARRLYEEWFVHFRFPGHEDAAFIDTEQGSIPGRWEIKLVADTFEIIGGGTPSKKEPEYWEGGTINWYAPTDLTRDKTAFMDKSGIQITDLGLKKSSAKLFPPMSVMMTSRATIGAIAINTTEAATNQGFITCLPNENFPLYLLYQWLRANVETFINLGTGATFKEITKGTFKTIPVIVPPQDIAKKYQETVEPMMKMSLNLQRKNDNLRAQRDLLLPKLISGEITVSEGENNLENAVA